MKHTPAPWKLDPYGDGMKPHRIYAEHEAVLHKGKRYPQYSIICDADGAMPTEETEANARLIAAAPELLEALEALLLDVEFAQSVIPAGYIGDRQVRNARAAIAKATGE